MIAFTPRPYQEEALQALHRHVCQEKSNPCVVIPTGGGKSVLMAWAIQRWKEEYSDFRVCVLAHRKELVAQNSQEMAAIWPDADIGVYAAGLKRRDTDNHILFASIDSVFKRGGEFSPFNVVIVDEAHRIPPRGEGKYREFIKLQQIQNKELRIIGFTATPFRMTGPLCHKDHILHKVCYEAKIKELIKDGYLCLLRSKRSKIQPDLSEVRRNNGGDYIIKSLSEAVDKNDVVSQAIKDAVSIIRNESRKSVMFFCVDVKHCHRVSEELKKHGVYAPSVTGGTPARQRDHIAEQFKAGRIKAVCNVNVYTEGFNAKQIDCIVLLRPTLSKGLYVQMIGRGFRMYPGKKDCLILDYAHCIDEHGPIDCVDEGRIVLYDCCQCGDTFSRQLRKCPNCGWEIPKQEIEAAEAEERERRLHEAKTSQQEVLSGVPEEIPVSEVHVYRHKKQGKPDSLRIEYRCGMRIFREWICLDHNGLARQKAHYWWLRRFHAPVLTIDELLGDFESDYAANLILTQRTKTITVRRTGKYTEIIDYDLRTEKEVEDLCIETSGYSRTKHGQI